MAKMQILQLERKEKIKPKQPTHCCYCRRPFSRSVAELSKTDDHFYPTSRGGLNSVDNRIACCFECNQWKGDRLPADFLKIVERAFKKNWKQGTYCKRDLAQVIGSLKHYIDIKKVQHISNYKL
jgi:5-methylcytosine-specific restriction endonuclease McrA